MSDNDEHFDEALANEWDADDLKDEAYFMFEDDDYEFFFGLGK